MRELSYAGFSVFHDEALQPLYKHRIPVVIKHKSSRGQRNLYSPHREVTDKNQIIGISCDKDFTVINIKKYLMNRQIGFTRRILEILENYHISFDHMPSGIDNISIIMRSNQIKNKENEVLSAIRKM